MDMSFEVPVAELDTVRVGLRAEGHDAHAGNARMGDEAIVDVHGVDDAAAVVAAVERLASRFTDVTGREQ